MIATNVLQSLNAQIFVIRTIIKPSRTYLLRTRPVVEARLAVKGCHGEGTAKAIGNSEVCSTDP